MRLVRRGFLLAISIACIGGAFASTRAAFRTSTSILTADASEKYLGTLNQEEKREGTFVLSNMTGRLIEIVRVIPTCKCTLTKLSETFLEDGSSVDLVATLNSGHARGIQTSSIDVIYQFKDTSEQIRLPLTLTATIIPDFLISPSDLCFYKDTVDPQVLRITNRLSGVRIIGAYATHSAFFVESPKDPDADNCQSVRVFLRTESIDEHVINGEIVLNTMDSKEPEFRIKVRFLPTNAPQ